jgi:NAD-dependent oxidoreductase involved in siderophore biosynthesis
MNKRPIRVEGPIAYVPLACGAEAIIDAEDAELVGLHNWYLDRDGRAKTKLPKVNGKRRVLLLHRLVMGDPEGLEVDHRNNDPLDNRKALLRPATRAENAKNRKANSNNTSGHKGVHWSKRAKKWQALIGHEGRQKHLGYFTDLEEAAQAYKEAAIRLHKEFANFG